MAKRLRWIHRTVAKTHGVPEDVVRRIYEVVKTSKEQGLRAGYMADFVERHIGRRLRGHEYGVYKDAKEYWNYDPPGGYGGPTPTGIAKEPLRASSSDPKVSQAQWMISQADKRIDEAVRRSKERYRVDAKDLSVFRQAADELCVGADLYEEAGAKVVAGTLRERSKLARGGDYQALDSYRSHLTKRATGKRAGKRAHLAKQASTRFAAATSDHAAYRTKLIAGELVRQGYRVTVDRDGNGETAAPSDVVRGIADSMKIAVRVWR